jgi:AcrR family transcriptional regulator
LAVASQLFTEHGVRSVGLQQIVDETGLGKSLFYREFASKDDLVAAWLREGRETWAGMADAATQPYDGDPERQLLALIEFVRDSVRRDDFHGCIFYNTLSEFRDLAHPARREAVAHLECLRERLERHSRAAGASDPQGLADTLILIVGGVFVNGVAFGPNGPADHAMAAAEAIIRQACASPAVTPGKVGRVARARKPASRTASASA